MFSAFFSTLVMNIFDGGRLDSSKDSNEFSKCGCIMEIIILLFFGIFLVLAIILDVVTYPIQAVIKYIIKCFDKNKNENIDSIV